MLQNKVVVVTGASGGLGAALVRRFVDEGAMVAGIARSKESLDALAESIESDRFSSYVADVSNIDQIDKAVSEIIERYQKIDFLFNNAAVYPKINFLEESPQDWLDAINVNLGGISNCTKAVLPVMLESGFGRIYNLGSFADINPIANSAAYSCSKGGVHALTKAIAADIAELNADVEIHEWIPGHLNTQMSDYTGIDPDISAGWAVEIATGKIKASKNNTIFENNREWQPPQRLKQRIKNKLMFWK